MSLGASVTHRKIVDVNERSPSYGLNARRQNYFLKRGTVLESEVGDDFPSVHRHVRKVVLGNEGNGLVGQTRLTDIDAPGKSVVTYIPYVRRDDNFGNGRVPVERVDVNVFSRISGKVEFCVAPDVAEDINFVAYGQRSAETSPPTQVGETILQALLFVIRISL